MRLGPDEVDKAAADAARLVQKVPTEYRAAAFQAVFGSILVQIESASSPHRSPKAKKSTGRAVSHASREEMLDRILGTSIDFSEFQNAIDGGTWTERAAAVLWILERELGVDALTPREFATVMTKQLRLPFVYASNINRELRRARGMFLRSQEGKGFKYALTSAEKARLASVARGAKA